MVYLARPDGLEWSMYRTHGMCDLPRYLQCTMAQGAMVILAIDTTLLLPGPYDCHTSGPYESAQRQRDRQRVVFYKWR